MSLVQYFLSFFTGNRPPLVATDQPLYFKATITTAITLTARLN